MASVLAALAIAVSSTSASAQLFDFLFGGARRALTPPPSVSAYADPYPGYSREGEQRSAGGPAVAFCVRLCDGRYLTMQRSSGGNAGQLCNSFCPAADPYL